MALKKVSIGGKDLLELLILLPSGGFLLPQIAKARTPIDSDANVAVRGKKRRNVDSAGIYKTRIPRRNYSYSAGNYQAPERGMHRRTGSYAGNRQLFGAEFTGAPGVMVITPENLQNPEKNCNNSRSIIFTFS
jgi:hypothetical protein